MSKVFKEIFAFVCVLIVAAIIIVPITLTVTTGKNYDTFNGSINKIPINISSPTYGIILSMPAEEGSTVVEGQMLAQIQILDPHFTPPALNKLYSVQKNILSIKSPGNGILGKISVAPQSTVASSQMLIQMYTADNMDIQISLPQGKDIHDYVSLYASINTNSMKYPLHLMTQIPTDIVTSTSSSTMIYRAKCVKVEDCKKIIDMSAVIIYAQKNSSKQKMFEIPFISSYFDKNK